MRIVTFLKIYKNNKLILQQLSKCILSNFRVIMFDWLATFRDYNGYGYSWIHYYVVNSLNAPDNDDSYGIVVGSGAMPVTPDDTSLTEKITHGTSTGQLDYDESEVNYEIDYANKRGYIYVKRSFKNLSDSDVTVRECGIVLWRKYRIQASVIAPGIDEKKLIVRDVLTQSITLHPYEQLMIQYTFQIG